MFSNPIILRRCLDSKSKKGLPKGELVNELKSDGQWFLEVHGRTYLANFEEIHVRTIWVFPKIGVGPPRSSILIGFSIINHPFWGAPIFGNMHIKINSGNKILVTLQYTGWFISKNDNEKSPSLIGDTSSNCCFFQCHVSFPEGNYFQILLWNSKTRFLGPFSNSRCSELAGEISSSVYLIESWLVAREPYNGLVSSP